MQNRDTVLVANAGEFNSFDFGEDDLCKVANDRTVLEMYCISPVEILECHVEMWFAIRYNTVDRRKFHWTLDSNEFVFGIGIGVFDTVKPCFFKSSDRADKNGANNSTTIPKTILPLTFFIRSSLLSLL